MYAGMGARGSRATVRFLKMPFIVHCCVEESQNQHFLSTLLGARKKGDKIVQCVCS